MYNRTNGINYYAILLLLASHLCYSQNVAPTLTAIGNQLYCPKSQIHIVTDFDIVDPDDTEIDALFIQISTGYVQGADTLILTGDHPNVLAVWNATEGKLILIGKSSSPVSYTELITAVKNIVFQSISNNPSNKTFSITIGTANFLPSTGHYYEFVSSIGITWTEAKTAADNRTYFGLQGYLATVTSAAEAQLTGEQSSGAGWIGGSDAETEGVWKWVTGPEMGTVFWNGLSNGSTPNYAFWNTNEPNQAGDEDYAHITAPTIGIPGSWNDLSNTGAPSGVYQPKGYIMEYGGLPGDPILNISASSSIYTSRIIDTKSATICGSGALSLEATALEGDVLWFDTLIGGTPLYNGQVFTTPTLNFTTTYYALASVNGCLEGVRVPVTATVVQRPSIVSINNDLICDSGSGVLSATASTGIINWYDVPTGGMSLHTGASYTTPTLNATTTYYVDATINGCTTLTRTPVTASVQVTSLPTGNTIQSFCDIEEATISNLGITGDSILWYASASGGVPLDTSILLTTNTYYATQTINTCESMNRLPVNVTVYETVVLPQTSNIPDLSVCDSDLDGDDTNGYATFDLTTNESILLNGKSSSDFTFYYFTDAAYTNLIQTPSNQFINTIQNNQTVYVRIENNLDATCYTDISFDVNVYELPVIQPSITLINCDEDTDGFTNFNLNEANAIISNNSEELTFTYHLSLSDANTNKVNTINASSFNNTIANVVYVRVESIEGCFRVSTINLQVSTTSFPQGFLQELETCDEDDVNDGFYVFDLNLASELFIAEFPSGQSLSVHYYRNLNDAQLEQNEIVSTNAYKNEEAFSQLLYVRVESDDNGACFGLGPHLLLTVHPRPEFEIDQTGVYCLDNNPISLFTFNPKGAYSYEWYDANGGIVSTQSNAIVTVGGLYSVKATSNFGCESFVESFEVVESAKAVIEREDIAIVELSDNNSITINNENNNLGIGDYEFALDDINGPYGDEPFFDRVGAGSHIIYVKDKNRCGIAELEVFILGFPKFFTPNADGYNDVWKIKGLGLDFSSVSTVRIYDRYGKLIKQLNAKNGEWTGQFNGELLPESDYWFIAELVEISGRIKTYRGHFSLIR
ncbi:hypothetical protein GCM10023311_28620 [Flaviramulus aquimarinus]|uniref:C-type lectin domain-containing protein n=1 Tax=Flaviramulus aquimarinus TaxID=1170456 RepID=A0ABP9FI47_9FLAO